MTRLDKTARVLERRRNFLRGEIAAQGDDVCSWDAQEVAALDEALVVLYDTGRATRRPGVEPMYRTYQYFPSQYEQAIERVRALVANAVDAERDGCDGEPSLVAFRAVDANDLSAALEGDAA